MRGRTKQLIILVAAGLLWPGIAALQTCRAENALQGGLQPVDQGDFTRVARQSSKKSSARARNRFRDANRLRQEEGVDARRINEAAERIRGRYPASIASKIITRKIWIGMTREMATDSWGQPDDVNRTVSEDIVRERWVYETEQTSLYFVDGVLDAWEKETGHSAIETQEGSDSGSDRP